MRNEAFAIIQNLVIRPTTRLVRWPPLAVHGNITAIGALAICFVANLPVLPCDHMAPTDENHYRQHGERESGRSCPLLAAHCGSGARHALSMKKKKKKKITNPCTY